MNDDAPKITATETPVVEETVLRAWQPFTPRGVAAFAQSSYSRVLFLQNLVAILASVVVVWFLNINYVPSILEAVQHLPDAAAFENGKLARLSSGVLTQKKFLSIVVDLEGTGQSGQTADVQIELRKDYFRICSLLGCGLFVYPEEKLVIGRTTLEPWWGARSPVILALSGTLVFLSVWAVWLLLALLYAPVAVVVCYINDRELDWCGGWRLASSAQMSGAILMSLVILLYGLQVFDLIQFLFFSGLHFFVAWIYVFAAPFYLPPVPAVAAVPPNPFDPK